MLLFHNLLDLVNTYQKLASEEKKFMKDKGLKIIFTTFEVLYAGKLLYFHTTLYAYFLKVIRSNEKKTWVIKYKSWTSKCT